MKIYPSSSAFCWHDLVITDYSSGCIRSILLTAHGKRVEISEESKAIGAEWEEEVESRLKLTGVKYDRELPFKYEVDGVTVSGRCDFVVHTEGNKEVLECKATGSKYVLADVIKKGKVKINHLAQLVNYLNFFETDTGKIMVTYQGQQERTFTVTLDDAGQIMIDGKFSGYNAADQVQHTLNAAKAINETLIWERPSALSGDPCRFCSHKDLCLEWDQGLITKDEFIKRGIE